ncbi:DUF4143 domain-containing protein [Candidatus Amarolinea dominans]|nr:DUF4143 domain-containing protein [Anaerolineae bacterium]
MAELTRQPASREEPAIYFWRTAAGAEVDVIVETAAALIPVEIKAAVGPQ